MSTRYESDSDTYSSSSQPMQAPRISRVERNAPSLYVKKRVDLATSALSEDRCLLEETASNIIVEHAYILPRETSRELLSKLEYSWGMKWRTLNVNSRYNILRLGVKFRRLFDDNKWLLLPSQKVVQQYYDSVNSGERICPDTPETDIPHEYTLVAHPDMIDVPILRRNMNIPGSPPPHHAYTILTYPYPELSSLKSHISPHYVICNAAQKLAAGDVALAYPRTARELAAIGSHSDLDELLRMVLFIYQDWKQPVPDPTSFFTEDEQDVVSDTSKHTGRYRVTKPAENEESRRDQGMELARPAVGKRIRTVQATTRLSRRALFQFNEISQVSAQREKKQKLGDIRHWAAEVATSAESAAGADSGEEDQMQVDGVGNFVARPRSPCSPFLVYGLSLVASQAAAHAGMNSLDVEPALGVECNNTIALIPVAVPPRTRSLSAASPPDAGKCGVADNELPDKAKKRIDAALDGLSQDRCLIEEMSPVGGTVEYSHAVAMRTHPDILDRLEFSWKLQHYTLNVDSRYNIFRLGLKFRALFNGNNFLLIPSPDVVDAYYNAIRSQGKNNPKLCRQAGPSMKEEAGIVHLYTLIAHPSMIDIPILRRNGPITASPPPSTAYTIMAYPYHELGLLKSHITPHYIIANAGEKVTNRQYPAAIIDYNETITHLIAQGAPQSLVGILEKIRFIYTIWTAAVSADERFLLSGEKDDGFSDTTEMTPRTRARSR